MFNQQLKYRNLKEPPGFRLSDFRIPRIRWDPIKFRWSNPIDSQYRILSDPVTGRCRICSEETDFWSDSDGQFPVGFCYRTEPDFMRIRLDPTTRLRPGWVKKAFYHNSRDRSNRTTESGRISIVGSDQIQYWRSEYRIATRNPIGLRLFYRNADRSL